MIKKSQAVLHEPDQPDAVLDLLDTNILADKQEFYQRLSYTGDRNLRRQLVDKPPDCMVPIATAPTTGG